MTSKAVFTVRQLVRKFNDSHITSCEKHSDAIRCISCEMQLCCCMPDVRGGTAVVGALYVELSYKSACPEI